MTVTFCTIDGPPVARVAYAVGRRVGGAVERNRLRRRLRAVVAELSGVLSPGAYLVSAGGEAARLGHEELKRVVAGAMRNASRDEGT